MTKLAIGHDVPFAQHLGIQTVTVEPGRVVATLDLRPELLNSWQVAHGGAIMTILDMTLGYALRTTDPDLPSVAAIELKVNFLAPGTGRIVAEGRVLHRGGSISVCEGEARDGTGRLIAKAVGTFKLLRKKEAAAK